MASAGASGYIKTLQTALARYMKQGFSKALPQMEIVSADEKRVTVEFTVTEEIANPRGSLHGGCTASVVDVVSTLGLLCSDNPRPGVSVNLNVNYVGAATIGDKLIVESSTAKVGSTLAYLNIIISNKDNGKVIATGTHVKHLGFTVI